MLNFSGGGDRTKFSFSSMIQLEEPGQIPILVIVQEKDDTKHIIDLLFFIAYVLLFLILPSQIFLFYDYFRRSRQEDSHAVVTFFGTKDSILPHKSKALQAAFDLYFHDTHIVPSDSVTEIDLQIGVKIPKGYFGWITLRSSAHRKKIIVHGGAIIDAYFTGVLKVYLFNLSRTDTEILERGSSLLQLLIIPCHQGDSRLVHPKQVQWTLEHIALRTGSSGNIPGSSVQKDEETRIDPTTNDSDAKKRD